MPTMMNEAFMPACHGEQTMTDEGFGYGPHAVFPRSLITRVFKLKGIVQAEATATCATKNCAARSHARAPSRRVSVAPCSLRNQSHPESERRGATVTSQNKGNR